MERNGKRCQEERSRKPEVIGEGAWGDILAGLVNCRIGYT